MFDEQISELQSTLRDLEHQRAALSDAIEGLEEVISNLEAA